MSFANTQIINWQEIRKSNVGLQEFYAQGLASRAIGPPRNMMYLKRGSSHLMLAVNSQLQKTTNFGSE